MDGRRWALSLLAEFGSVCYSAGCTLAEMNRAIQLQTLACLCASIAGYGPCLAATLHLHKHKLLARDTPGKVGGPPGNAFEVVYGGVTDAVRKKMHAVDPVLGEYIRLHLYGDVYSSPGLDLQQKQLLMVSFLAEANMHDQLFGHLLAAFKFGNSQSNCLKAIDIAFELAPKASSSVYKSAMKTLAMAHKKFLKDGGLMDDPPDVLVLDPESIRLPPLPTLFNTTTALAAQATLGGDDLQQMLEETQMDAVSFAWDEIKP